MRIAPALLACLPVVRAVAAEAPAFEKDVAPVLARHCTGCHGASVQMGGLDLRSLDTIVRGGSKGPAIVKAQANGSLLYQRITDRSMPPGKVKVNDVEAAAIRRWIDAGAPGGPESRTAALAAPSSHWAFRSPRRPLAPNVVNKAWVRTPVDAFILAALEAKGISPVKSADSATLLRRMSLTLTGLPPDASMRRQFLSGDGSHERLTEYLLASPHYGERWARRWLDVARYAESNGYERDGTKPNAWRYRDWVIDAFNRDKPYDRFVTEQLAGDEIEGSNAETQIATTFLRLGTWDDEPAEPKLDRFDQLDDIIGATSAAFLGVTLRCARCHDHKFEPFTQRDYYRMLAVFSPLKRPQKDRADLDRLAGTPDEIKAFEESKAKADAQERVLNNEVAKIKKVIQARVIEAARKNDTPELRWLDHLETVLAFQVEPARRNKEQKALVARFEERLDREIDRQATAEERTKLSGLRTEIARVNAGRVPEPPRAYVWYEDTPQAEPTYILERGDVSRPGEPVGPGVPAILSGGSAGLPSRAPLTKSTGRRLSLARWMTSPDNPLVARVMVNRIWQGHFGEGLVPSENDFGVAGQSPTYPELLDWLAREFIDSGWSVKHIQRLIVNSNTFRLSSDWNEAASAADAGGKLIWRWSPRRLDAEMVRDEMLAVAGELNPALHGPSIYPELPRAVLEGQSVPGQNWGKSEGGEAARRSIYIHVKRSLAVPELELLDAPDSASSCEQRAVSTTGPQALTFLNGAFTHQRARAFASRLEGSTPAEQVADAFARAFGRAATPEEIRTGADFVAAQRGQFSALALVLLNSNEFMYLY